MIRGLFLCDIEKDAQRKLSLPEGAPFTGILRISLYKGVGCTGIFQGCKQLILTIKLSLSEGPPSTGILGISLYLGVSCMGIYKLMKGVKYSSKWSETKKIKTQ